MYEIKEALVNIQSIINSMATRVEKLEVKQEYRNHAEEEITFPNTRGSQTEVKNGALLNLSQEEDESTTRGATVSCSIQRECDSIQEKTSLPNHMKLHENSTGIKQESKAQQD